MSFLQLPSSQVAPVEGADAKWRGWEARGHVPGSSVVNGRDNSAPREQASGCPQASAYATDFPGLQ